MNHFRTVFPHFCLSCRLESQMTTDIQTILQLLQKQTTVVPPAYSMVTAGAEYHSPTLRLMRTSYPGASIKTDRSFSPSSQVSVNSAQPRGSLKGCSRDHLNQDHVGCCGKGTFSFYLIRISHSYAHLKFENKGPRWMILKQFFFLKKKLSSSISLLQFAYSRALKAKEKPWVQKSLQRQDCTSLSWPAAPLGRVSGRKQRRTSWPQKTWGSRAVRLVTLNTGALPLNFFFFF